ncbi:MAG: isopentenyl-diphosphate Delta-isomerase [Actinomycetota bacterium]|nr:isopentenyl-diphosphate Delta-isomerase [Actinomycetota bacterium]
MEQVVLLDEAGVAIDVADKATVHHQATPLHLAFSVYVFNPTGELLITRRAPSKQTWPDIWTNSCCGHPQPGEPLPEAVSRRLHHELALPTAAIDIVLPRFRYRATMPNGLVENEMCPVFKAFTDADPTPNPTEVAECRWTTWPKFVQDVLSNRLTVSPWCREQTKQLSQLGPQPTSWAVAATDELPRAATASPSTGGGG